MYSFAPKILNVHQKYTIFRCLAVTDSSYIFKCINVLFPKLNDGAYGRDFPANSGFSPILINDRWCSLCKLINAV
jgi:hypothetical protein